MNSTTLFNLSEYHSITRLCKLMDLNIVRRTSVLFSRLTETLSVCWIKMGKSEWCNLTKSQCDEIPRELSLLTLKVMNCVSTIW